ncbi:MAG TPA: hypothetical protein VG712_07390, partial [Gemmatimonadales bacterium]|nr:hypothetical protein [Gemmatimonadales bacterium]
LAGLFIVETMLVEPRLFRRYIALSPSLWWNDDALLRTAPAQAARIPSGTSIYLSMAGEPGIGPQSDTLDVILRAHLQRGVRHTYHPRPDLTHGTIYLGEGPAALVAALQ